MRILFISDFSLDINGGIQHHIKHLWHVMESQHGAECFHLHGGQFRGFKIIGKNVRSLRGMKHKIEEICPDIIHVHGFTSLFIIQVLRWVMKNDHKVIYTPHYHPFHTLTRPLLAKLVFALIQKRILKKVPMTVTLSAHEQAFFLGFHKPNELVKIPNGVILDQQPTTRAIRQRELLFIGRNVQNKRLDFLMEQDAFFADHDIYVNVVSNDESLKDFGQFKFHSNLSQEELNGLYQRVSGLVVPSRYEAFSLVAIEALAHYCWVLISDQVQIKDYFAGSKAMDTFKYADINEFQEKLLLKIEKNDDLRIADFPDLEDFTWGKVAETTYSIYQKVVS